MDEPTQPTTPGPPPPEPARPVPPAAPDRSDRAFAVARWTLALGVTLLLAILLAWGSLLLTLFGLGGIALAIGVLLTLTGALVWRRGMLPLAVLAVAATIPAAGATLQSLRIDRTAGLLEARPTTMADLDQRTTYRRGAGTVFVDLRNVTLPRGRTTRIAARSDLGQVVVALSSKQCVAATIRYRYTPTSANAFTEGALAAVDYAGLDHGTRNGIFYTSLGLGEAAAQRADQRLSYGAGDFGLLAWGSSPDSSERALPDGRREFVRAVDDPSAAKLELDLTSAQQIVVRDYPAFAGPLDTNFAEQVAGQSWPMSVQPPQPPGVGSRDGNTSVRTHRNRAAWTAWERKVIAWGAAQSRRYAGPCATKQQLRDRAYGFDTQLESVRTDSGRIQLLTGGPSTERSPIKGQPVGRSENFRLRVEVNGLGEVKVLGQFRGRDGYYPAESSSTNEVIS